VKSARDLAAGRAREALEAVRAARTYAETAFTASMPTRRRPEFRGAWIHSPEVPHDDWGGFFKAMKQANLNALLPNVCSAGVAHYDSDLMPLSDLVKSRGPQMQKMMSAAKRNAIELHLWRVNLRLGGVGAAAVNKLKSEGRICLDRNGKVVGGPNGGTLCPSHPENQRLEVAAMLEMARKFKPDGVHFDYIRYPNATACYCQGCRARFERFIGRAVAEWPKDVLSGGALHERYQQFRRDQITAIVREASRRLRAEAPAVKISAAVFSNWETARDRVGQDWVKWVETGLLDFVCPMDYTTNAEELAQIVARQRRWVGGRVPLYVGVGAYRAGAAWQVADLTETAFAQGADGVVYFQIRGRSAVDAILRQVEGPLRAPARTPWAD
jgi:uncharacterized lipoprotein YddW (UPF0748 family)